jgi:hypothetical protein
MTRFNKYGEIDENEEVRNPDTLQTGGFYHSSFEIPFSQEFQDHINSRKNIIYSPEVHEGLLKEYTFFRENIYDPQRVFYPSCNVDVTPISAFPNSEVVLLDRDEGVAKSMQKHGIEQFVQSDIHDYIPGKEFDLVIALNPQLHSRDITKYLSIGGYALANNWHQNANQLMETPNFEYIGQIDDSSKGMRLSPRETKSENGGFYVFKKLENIK